MKGIDKVADVDALLRAIMPWRLTNSDFVSFQSAEVLRGHVERDAIKLEAILARFGF